MILRFLFWLLAMVGTMWLWRRLQRAALAQSGRTTATGPSEVMVRDRICQTFLPQADAIKVKNGGKTHFFCSDTCRDQFLRSV
jgi:YHS domain-containing protein